MSKLSYVPGNSIIPEGCFGISPSQLHRFFSKPHEWYRTEVLKEEGFTGSTSSVLGTIIHFIAEEFIKTKSVDKSAIYEHLYDEYVVDKSRTVPSFSDEEAIEDFKGKILDHTLTAEDIDRVTARLGDDIADVYGFRLPEQRKNHERNDAR